jgi:acetyltransferase-like isoleucine patch superfamily enzyme
VGGNISIGDSFHLTSGDAINPINRNIRACFHLGSPDACITIGDHVGMSSPCVWIQSRLTIGNHVNIGGNCTILKGVTIGARSIIGAGSVVTKSIPADCIAAGNPCKIIREMV